MHGGSKTLFIMQVKSKDGTITALSGQLGDFVFRTFKNGKIFATYAPRRSRPVPESIPNHFREQMKDLNLEIIKE